MKFHPHALRIATLPLANILIIIALAALHPVSAAPYQGESEAERFVLQQLENSEEIDLAKLPEDKRQLSARFIVNLLTGRDDRLKTPRFGIALRNAVIPEFLDLGNQKIALHLALISCHFEGGVNFSGSKFALSLQFFGCAFDKGVFFADASIGRDFIIDDCHFRSTQVTFKGMQVERDFIVNDSFVVTEEASFENARVAGVFVVQKTRFDSKLVLFNGVRVEGTSTLVGNTFTSDAVAFVNAHFSDVFLDESTFNKVDTIDFTRTRADFISLDGVKSLTPSKVKNQRMTFKMLSPVNAGKLAFLLSPYNAEFYTQLEASWRTHGYQDDADNIYIAKRRAERRENCKSFLHQCHLGPWGWSMFQDMLAGYGKSLKNLLYWSLGFLLVGTLVFRREKGMRIKDERDAPHYAGRYNAFWYSLDLFLPIIKLGEADVWTPKDDRRWANRYRKVHIIIGSLFVPIGLAAWTGIIR